MRRPALALLAAALLVAGGCGGDATDESASRLLQRGFATDVGTRILRLDATVELEGGPVEGAFQLELEGPFRSSGPTELPEADMEFRASGAGQGYEGRAILTRANAWVEFRGETYEVGEELWARAREPLRAREEQPETLLEAGVDPMDWLRAAGLTP